MLTLVVEEAAEVKFALLSKRVNVIVDPVVDSVMEMVVSEEVLFQIIVIVEEVVEEVALAMLSNVVNVKEAINANFHMRRKVMVVEDHSVEVVTVKSVSLSNVVNAKEVTVAAFLTKLAK